jgi:predicted NBD/HSP70 family sugar kinase
LVLSGPVIGVDIGGSKMRICVLSQADGDCLQFNANTCVDTTPKDLADFINDVIDRLPHPPSAIGVAVPGLVEHAKVVVSDVLPKISGWSPATSIAAPCRVVVLNDAEAALVEAAAALPAGATAAMIMVGTGIGMALLIEGKIYRGARGMAGELGSIPTSPQGPLVTLDNLAAGAPLLRELGARAVGISLHPDAAQESDRTAIDRAGAALGFGLATLINVMNLERIILGGGTLRFPGYLESALKAAQLRTLPQLWEACVIEEALDSETLVARGAARRARELS